MCRNISFFAGTVTDLATYFIVMVRLSLTVAFPQYMTPDLQLNVVQRLIVHAF